MTWAFKDTRSTLSEMIEARNLVRQQMREAKVDNAFVRLQAQTEHLEMCGKDCSFEHKRDQPELHKPANCVVCGAHQPSGHVFVNDQDGARVGRVCSTHTFMDLVFNGRVRVDLRFW